MGRGLFHNDGQPKPVETCKERMQLETVVIFVKGDFIFIHFHPFFIHFPSSEVVVPHWEWLPSAQSLGTPQAASFLRVSDE